MGRREERRREEVEEERGEGEGASDVPTFISVERHLRRVYFPLGLISGAVVEWHAFRHRGRSTRATTYMKMEINKHTHKHSRTYTEAHFLKQTHR